MALTNHNMRLKMHYVRKMILMKITCLCDCGQVIFAIAYILLAVHLIGNMPSELRGMKDNNRKEPWLLSYPYVQNDLSRNANRLNCCGYHPS